MLTYFIENRRHDIISLNQPRGVSVGMAENGIWVHAHTSQRRTLALIGIEVAAILTPEMQDSFAMLDK